MSSQKARAGIQWSRLLASVAVLLLASASLASAQTVMIRNAPPGAPLEVVLNADTVASGAADQAGEATLKFDISAGGDRTEIDANVFVDVCPDNTRRVLIIERGQPVAAQPAGCDRRDSGALFLIRRISTLIVNVGGTIPTVVLRQGNVRVGPPRIRRPPRGLVVFGGAGLSSTRDFELIACGNVVGCSGDNSGAAWTGGADLWFTRYLGAEGAYLRPSRGEAGGTGTDFTFDAEFEAHIVTIAGKVGVPLGPVRLFGRFGTNYTEAIFTTTQTSGELSQALRLRTTGWGWQFGGGIEVWLAPAFAIYGDFQRLALKGTADEGTEGSIDDRMNVFFVGGRVRIAGR